MPQETFNQILNQLKTLEIEELRRLHQTIQQYLTNHPTLNEQTTFHQALLDSGLVKQIKHRSFEPINERKLIQIEGNPISETIIEERR